MASVHLSFIPPNREGFVLLRIFEAPDAEAGMSVIEIVTEIGDYPDYISEYSTDQATGIDKWFAIQWEDDKGVRTDISERIQGGTQTLVGKIVSRVLLSNPSLNEEIVAQSAEFVISTIMKTQFPYDPTLTATYQQMEGMTLLAQARAEIRGIISTSDDSSSNFTAGLVSMKSSFGSDKQMSMIGWLVDEANKLLGLNIGIVARMVLPEIAGGLSEIVDEDTSRLMLVEMT